MSAHISTNEKPRILYFIAKYPTFSETYMHEELRALWEQFDIKVVSLGLSQFPRRLPFAHEVVEYREAMDLIYGNCANFDMTFNTDVQQEFLNRVVSVIEEFKPHVLHGHYFGMSPLLAKLAEHCRIPFTVRTHSMDMLSEPPEKTSAFINAANSKWCLRILTYPAFRSQLIERGMRSEKVVSCWPVINFARFHKPQQRQSTGKIMCGGPAIPKKAHLDFIKLAVAMEGKGLQFDLYTRGREVPLIEAFNRQNLDVVKVTYADPDDMPDVYPNYDWLVYPSCRRLNKVGLPVSIPEAQASGLGVCWQELPGRREEQLDFLGGAGFLFQSLQELPQILERPYPEEMRQRGFEAAKRSDIEGHKGLLTEVWNQAPKVAVCL